MPGHQIIGLGGDAGARDPAPPQDRSDLDGCVFRPDAQERLATATLSGGLIDHAIKHFITFDLDLRDPGFEVRN
jgi:hypothetical protein